MKNLFAAVALALILPGCMVGERTTEPDSDTEGLPDVIETTGWNITITRTVYPCFGGQPEPDIEVRNVTSNELREDTDADGASDFDEFYASGDPQTVDTDGDGISDGEEFARRSDETFYAPQVLSLNRTDSDKDCVPDGDELKGVLVAPYGVLVSDPTVPDSDSDGLTDAAEFYRTKTKPWVRDTDGDGAPDRHDADPNADLWLRVRLTSLTIKDLPGSQSDGFLVFGWAIPAIEDGRRTHQTDAFEVHEGDTLMLEADLSPGRFDARDDAVDSNLTMDLYAFVTNEQGVLVEPLDINPHDPGQTVRITIDALSGQWAFKKTDGTRTTPGNPSSLETAQARISYDLAVGPENDV